MDTLTFKGFLSSIDDILENLEDVVSEARGYQNVSYFFHIYSP